MKWIIGTEEFNKNLDGWLSHNDQKNSDFLNKNKNKIPPTFRQYSGKLYRGMAVNADFIIQLEKGGVTFKTNSSWSKSDKVAKGFVNDPSFRIGKKTDTEIKILITKKINPSLQILDIDAFVMFMGIPQLEMQGIDELALDSALKEKEVLISSGIKITSRDIKFL